MSLWLADQPLVLASKSAIRGEILRAAGLAIEICPADIDERTIEQGSAARDPGAIAALLAREKAHAVAARLPGRAVLGADQTLALGERRFSKPQDRAAAREQLMAMRGKTHQLHSGVAVCRNGSVTFNYVVAAQLKMREFSEAFLDAYLDSAGSLVTETVGAYQLERTGIHLFEKIEGDNFTILGLPLLPLLQHLRDEGVLAA